MTDRIRLDDLTSDQYDQLYAERDAARATNRRLNRRAQELEAELAAYRRAVDQWEINERGTYVPLRTLAAIAKAAGLPVPDRWELHYERVEQAEAALARIRALLATGQIGCCAHLVRTALTARPADDTTPAGLHARVADAIRDSPARYHDDIATAVLAALAQAEQQGVHRYLSTGCLHGDHAYCQAMTGLNGAKRPGECKFCQASCRCGCHTDEEQPGPD
ncbi:hypothetical protein PV729_45370 [Streptomyces europaeiscabiei]|uniref:Uncharacterized protein n=1 Tax=Streptomyces europaeiscabiei TaxID=146819 RepID=A0ABU4NWS2_9ACTN|nr:hypothetical protein [Streptomyces europaeiscabiei]MDX3549719.1 hypothetical protein [Streptomyces europaeiscabiei]MDX3558806.1 hypothetical protein [Streptomyces europaeiscabiei]MDX3707258.1 hypothetical protein [Streptomyces europaeiscabiei]